jgi:16S rRNA processing protein RimM
MELVKLGSIVKAHGIKGEVKVFFDEELLSALKSFNHIFIEFKSGPLPYQITDIRKSNDKTYFVQFDECNDRSVAETLKGKEVFTDKKNLKKNSSGRGNSFCIGFILKDETLGELGYIEDVFEMPAHDVAKIMLHEKEILIPLNDSFITKADKKNKILHINLPEGILDVYLK